MEKQTLAATNWLYRGDHPLIVHHQGHEEPEFKWDDLPRDVFVSILSRVRPAELLTRVQYVCRLRRDVCLDPLLWRRVSIGNLDDAACEYTHLSERYAYYICPRYDNCDDYESLRRYIVGQIYRFLDRLYRLAVDRSLGSLESIIIHDIATDDLLHYIADRSRRLTHIELISCQFTYCSDRGLTEEGMISFAAKVPFLEKLELLHSQVTQAVIEAFARCCPLLVSFKFVAWLSGTCVASRVIAQQMPHLVHLQLGEDLTNDGLLAILDGCPHLESLDLYNCCDIDLDRELGLRCGERIKDFRRPYDPAHDAIEECSGFCCSIAYLFPGNLLHRIT